MPTKALFIYINLVHKKITSFPTPMPLKIAVVAKAPVIELANAYKKVIKMLKS